MLIAQLSKLEMWRSKVNFRAPSGLTWSLCSPLKHSNRTLTKVMRLSLTDNVLFFGFFVVEVERAFC